MPLISLQNITVGFGGPLLLEGVDLQIEPGERVCLVGRNGTGKSTIMRVITGEVKPDRGMVVFQQTSGAACSTSYRAPSANRGGCSPTITISADGSATTTARS
ncbi:MAG: transporter ATPase [Nitrospirae bacterium]|nr:transporter ATPase [Nitrospirota bacterium]